MQQLILTYMQDEMEREVDAYLRRKFETAIRNVEEVQMEDLDLKNHLSGLKRTLLKVSLPLFPRFSYRHTLVPSVRWYG